MRNQIQTASEVKNSSRTSTLAHETRKSVMILLFAAISVVAFGQSIDSKKLTKWIKGKSIELKDNSDFKQLAQLLTDKTVIGLGEAAHGSKTLNNIRFDLAKTLIQENGFNNLAFEMSFNTGLRINHYLQTGEGDIEEILKQTNHFFNKSEELLNFIKWIKEYNKNSANPVNIYGFDIQVGFDIIEDLLKYYAKTDKEAENLLSGFKPGGLPDSLRIPTLNRLRERHAANRNDYVLKSDFLEYEYAAKRLEVLSNAMQMEGSGFWGQVRMRASCNAEVIKWIKDFEGENSKLILFAHNGHLGKGFSIFPRVRTLSTRGNFYDILQKEHITGWYLRETFGDKYYWHC